MIFSDFYVSRCFPSVMTQYYMNDSIVMTQYSYFVCKSFPVVGSMWCVVPCFEKRSIKWKKNGNSFLKHKKEEKSNTSIDSGKETCLSYTLLKLCGLLRKLSFVLGKTQKQPKAFTIKQLIGAINHLNVKMKLRAVPFYS